MAYVQHKVGALVLADPKSARESILGAFTRARASRRDAARLLGCNEHTLRRWVSKLGIEKVLREIEQRAEREGWHHGKVGGRPRGARAAADD